MTTKIKTNANFVLIYRIWKHEGNSGIVSPVNA